MKFVEIPPNQFINLDSIEQVTFTYEDSPKGPLARFTDRVCTGVDVVFRDGNSKPVHLEAEAAKKLRTAIQRAP
jgi:hypothetical protein